MSMMLVPEDRTPRTTIWTAIKQSKGLLLALAIGAGIGWTIHSPRPQHQPDTSLVLTATDEISIYQPRHPADGWKLRPHSITKDGKLTAFGTGGDDPDKVVLLSLNNGEVVVSCVRTN